MLSWLVLPPHGKLQLQLEFVYVPDNEPLLWQVRVSELQAAPTGTGLSKNAVTLSPTARVPPHGSGQLPGMATDQVMKVNDPDKLPSLQVRISDEQVVPAGMEPSA